MFLVTYACGQNGCNEKIYGKSGLGHSEGWHNIAYTLELVAKDFFGMTLDSMRKLALILDICASKKKAVNVDKWGFKDDEIHSMAMDMMPNIEEERVTGRGFILWAIDQEKNL